MIHKLCNEFKLRDLRPLHYFLGIEVERTPGMVAFTQSKYIADLLFKTNMLDSKSIHTPMATTRRLSSDDNKPLSDPSQSTLIPNAYQARYCILSE